MAEKTLINQIKKLKDIGPEPKWLDLTRYQLIGRIDLEAKELESGFWQWFKAPQFDALVACLMLIFTAGPWLAIKAAEASLPGEWLYSLKRVSEELKGKVAAEEDKSQLQMEFAWRRVEELNRMTQEDSLIEENTEQVREVMNGLKENLAGASIYVDKVSPDYALAMAKKTRQVKQSLDRVKGQVSSVKDAAEVNEAEKTIGEISSRILTVLNKDAQNDLTNTSTTDQEIITFLEETSSSSEDIQLESDSETESELKNDAPANEL